MPKWMLAFLVALAPAACDAPAASGPSDGAPNRPPASALGKLTIRADTGVLVAGRQLHVEVDATDVDGSPVDAVNTELTSSNLAVAKLASEIAIPVSIPPAQPLYALGAAFDLPAAGTAAIRARLGLLSDSIVITVLPAM